VGAFDRVGDAFGDMQRVGDRQRPRENVRRKRIAFDEFHREIMVAVARADVINRHDVGMLQARHGFRFAIEAFDGFVRRVDAVEQNFQRDDAVEPGLARFVDDTETAAADFAEQFVAGELAFAREVEFDHG